MNTYLFQPKNYMIKPPKMFTLSVHNCTHSHFSENITVKAYLEKHYFQFDTPQYYFDFNYIKPNSRSPPVLASALREG